MLPHREWLKLVHVAAEKDLKLLKKNKKKHRVRNKEHDWKLVKKKVTLTNKKKQAFIN